MKTFTLSVIVLLFGINSHIVSQNFWQPTGFNYGGEVNAIIQANNGNIVACGNDKIYISPDGGTIWNLTATLSYEINCITKKVANGYLFVGRNASNSNEYGGVYRSVDDGQSWSSSGLTNRRIKTITVNSNGIIFTGSKGDYPNHTGIYKSIDNGTNWTLAGLPTYDIYILFSDTNGNIFAGTGNDGALFKSSNDGATWDLIYYWGITTTIQAFTIDLFGNYFIVQGNGKIFKSTDQGTSWVEVFNTYQSEACLLVNQANTIFCAVTGSGGVYKSDDSGSTWVSINSGLTNLSVHSLAIDTLCYLYAGVVNSICKSVQPTCIVPSLSCINVTINPPAAVTAGAQWNIDGGSWQYSGSTMCNLTSGVHTLNYKPISGWTECPSKSVTIIANNTIYESCTYIEQQVLMEINSNKIKYNLNEPVYITVTVTDQYGSPLPNKLIGIYDPDPNVLSCPVIYTNYEGKAYYNKQSITLEGWTNYGFFCDDIEKVYSTLVVNETFNDTALVMTEIDPVGSIPNAGTSTDPLDVSDVVDVGVQAAINTASNPIVIGSWLLCAGSATAGFVAGVAFPPTALAFGPLTGLSCGWAVNATYGTFVIEAAKNAAIKVIDHAPNPPYSQNDKESFKNIVNMVSWGYDMISFSKTIGTAPKSGTTIFSYKLSNNQGNLANQYANDFLDGLSSWSDFVNTSTNYFNLPNDIRIVTQELPDSKISISIVLSHYEEVSNQSQYDIYSIVKLNFNTTNYDFSLKSPINGDSTSIYPNFIWNPLMSDGSIKYIVQISKSLRFDSIFFESEEIDSCSYILNDNILLKQKMYYWRVMAIDQYKSIHYSNVSHFKTNILNNSIQIFSNSYYKLMIYPNPVFGDQVSCQINSSANTSIKLYLINSLGVCQKVLYESFSLTNDRLKVTIDLTLIPSGIYFIRGIFNKYSITQKLIIL